MQRQSHNADTDQSAPTECPLPPRTALALLLLATAAGCTMAVPTGVRKVDTAELQNIPTVVTAPTAAKDAAAANATPTTRRTTQPLRR